MGQRTLRIASSWLPVLMSSGNHHYWVGKDAVPEECNIVNAGLNFDGTELVLTLESEEWGDVLELPRPEIKPTFIRSFCPGVPS